MFRQDIGPFLNFTLESGGPSFSTEGCALCTVFSIVEQEKPYYFTVNHVKKFVKDMYKKKYINDEFTILGSEGWKGCFDILGLNVKNVRYVKDPMYVCKDNERESLKLSKPGYSHFVHGDGKGNYVYDSLGRRSQQKDYVISEKRIIEL